jgi:hypothetical protein
MTRPGGADPLVGSRPLGRLLATVHKGRRGRRPADQGVCPTGSFSSSVARHKCRRIFGTMRYAHLVPRFRPRHAGRAVASRAIGGRSNSSRARSHVSNTGAIALFRECAKNGVGRETPWSFRSATNLQASRFNARARRPFTHAGCAAFRCASNRVAARQLSGPGRIIALEVRQGASLYCGLESRQECLDNGRS